MRQYATMSLILFQRFGLCDIRHFRRIIDACSAADVQLTHGRIIHYPASVCYALPLCMLRPNCCRTCS